MWFIDMCFSIFMWTLTVPIFYIVGVVIIIACIEGFAWSITANLE